MRRICAHTLTTDQLGPPCDDQSAFCGPPVSLDIAVTARTLAWTVVVAKSALERLVTRSMELATSVDQERTAIQSIFVQGESAFRSLERR